MIKKFLNFLSQNNIEYRVTNGYENIFNNVEDSSDYDILFKKVDFYRIEPIIQNFCNLFDYKIVQIYHQAVLAKNIFVFSENTNTLLNLDLYGELTRQNIKILEEEDVFSTEGMFRGVHILAPHHEFIQYLIKKIDKGQVSNNVFEHLRNLYQRNYIQCDSLLQFFFKKNQENLQRAFREGNSSYIQENLEGLRTDFLAGSKSRSSITAKNSKRVLHRIFRPTGLAIAFLGPDGSGKSTIIKKLLKEELPFRRTDYFYLKPLNKIKSNLHAVSNPHGRAPYSILVSYFKMIFLVVQYNFGWFKNIIELKVKSSLIIFDRYYDDLLIDPKRYRLGVTGRFAKMIRFFIPKPDIFFILTSNPEILRRRKQEVPLLELQRQILEYRLMVDDKRCLHIDVNRQPEELVIEIKQIIMRKMHERY